MRRLLFGITAVAAAAAAQDAYDLPWRIAADGELEVRPLSDGVGKELKFGEWAAMFPGLFHRTAQIPDLRLLDEWGPMLVVPLLVHGDGGAAAIDDATLRMRKLGIATTTDYLPLSRLEPDPLLDLLYVRHLAALDLGSTSMALDRFAQDDKRDPFVRAAAMAALAARPSAAAMVQHLPEVRPGRAGSAALQDGLAHLPDDIDFVLGVHCAALPATAPLLRAWREVVLRFHSSVALSSGGSVPSERLSDCQLAMDRPGQLPFEIARRCGNWRVDHALLGIRGGDDGGFWIHLGGSFQPQRVVAGLDAGSFDVHAVSEHEVRASVHGVVVHVTRTSVRAWTQDLDPGPAGARVPLLQGRCAKGAAPVWVHVPAASRFTALLALGSALEARFDPLRGTASADAKCANAETAAKLVAAWEEWRSARRCDPDGRIEAELETTWGDLADDPPGCNEYWQTRLTWRRIVQAVRVDARGAEVTWSLDLAPFALLDLVRLLGAPPSTFLERG